MPRFSLKKLLGAITLLAVATAILLAAVPAIIRRVEDAHARAIAAELAKFEEQFCDGQRVPSRLELEYVENFYRLEDLPDYEGRPAVQELARQRQRTLEALKAIKMP
jgi:hypothetical protein